MQSVDFWLNKVETWVWGAPLLSLLVIVGLYLTFILRGIQFRYLGYSLKLAFTRQDNKSQGDISQFQALMTALAGMIGIGSITGVATAIAMGGLGAVFWLWVASLIGMATKYAEAILAVRYRDVDEQGQMRGGPMVYLEKGLKSKKLALFFSFAGAITALITGNMVQANSIAAAVQEWIDPLWVGVLLSIATGLALFGGIRSIGKVASWLVPGMAIFYILGGLALIILRIDALPQALAAIFSQAFSGSAMAGGVAGSSVMMAIQMGVSRSVFSNEAGLGTAPIAAAAAKTDVPGRQALISMSGVFLTSIVVCSISALAIAVSGLLGQTGADGQILNGSQLALSAFKQTLPFGSFVVILSLILFGYSTIIGWAFYGEKCTAYLFGSSSVRWYRLLFSLVLIPGAVLSLQSVWSFANIMNGLMAFPNLIGLLGLSAIVAAETREFEKLLRFEHSSTRGAA